MIQQGLEPACSATCPTGALKFGNRDDLLREARQRIAYSPDRYIDHIYGEKEVGGTSVIHLAGVPFEQIGYVCGLPEKPLATQIAKPMQAVPFAMTSMTAILGGLFWIMKRRDEVQKTETENE